MYINCLCLFKDIVLKDIITRYLKSTPFFKIEEYIQVNSINYDTIDLIFIENCLELENTISTIIRNYDNPCIVLSHNKDISKIPFKENIIIIPKRIDFTFFSSKLSNIIDDYNNTIIN